MVNMDSRSGSIKRERTFSSGRSFSTKVYVSNIDFSCTHNDLKNVFSEAGEVAFVEMLKDGQDRTNGTALIRFKDSSSTEEAIRTLNRVEVKGRKIVVKDEHDAPKGGKNERDWPGSQMNDRNKRGRMGDGDFDHGRGGGGGGGGMPMLQPNSGGGDFGNTYGLSTSFLEALGIDPPLTNKVFVANLDYSVNEDDLREIFSLAGQLDDIDIVKGDDGKSKGYGFLEYEHPVEAVQAISMLQNQIFCDRPLSVALTRKERKRDGPPRLPQGLKGLGFGLGVNGAPLKHVARTVAAGSIPGASSFPIIPAQNPVLLMGGGTMAPPPMNVNPQIMGMNMGNPTMGMGMGMNSMGGLTSSRIIQDQAALMARSQNSAVHPGMGLLNMGNSGLAGRSILGTGASLMGQSQPSGFSQEGGGGRAFDQSQQSRIGGLAFDQSNLRGGRDMDQSRQSMVSGGEARAGDHSSSSNSMGRGDRESRPSRFSDRGNDRESSASSFSRGRGSSHAGRGLAGDRPPNPSQIQPFGSSSGSYAGHSNSSRSASSSKNVVEIENLPQDYTWKDLKTFCTPFGDVKFAKIPTRGMGLVHFESDDDARSAVDMLNNQHMDGKYLKLKIV